MGSSLSHEVGHPGTCCLVSLQSFVSIETTGKSWTLLLPAGHKWYSSYCCSGLPHQHRNILNGWAHIITHVCSLGRIQDQTNILLLGKARRMSRHTGKSFLKAQWTNVVVWTPESALRPTILMIRVQALRGNLKFQNMLLKIKKLIIIFEASQPIQLFSHEVVFIVSGKMFLHPILFKVWGCLNEPPPFWREILSCQICCWNK